MTDWQGLADELAAWRDAGTVPTFWWRDDDAAEPSDALARLFDLRAAAGVPLALAVIPGRLSAALPSAIPDTPDIAVLQHGYAHTSHAPAGEKKAELGDHRPVWEAARDLMAGRERLIDAFGDRPLSVLVPPWNRIAGSVVEVLAGLGYCGLSTFGARTKTGGLATLGVTNTHVDIIDWRGLRGFAGDAPCIAAAVAHLAARRAGTADPNEPTGLLTHHLVHDEACEAFIARFVDETTTAGAAWRQAAHIFPEPDID